MLCWRIFKRNLALSHIGIITYFEDFPIIVLEFLVCGIPVISANCPSGPGEIITDGVNGFLVPVGDILAMSEAILKLLKDEKLRKDIAAAGKIRAGDFLVEKMVSEYESVFENIIIK